MSFLKTFNIIVGLLLFVFIFSGCNWGARDVDTNRDADESAVSSPTATAGTVVLENFRELGVSSEGLVAGSYDGQLAWSPDGTLVAIGMSNQTLASAQTQLLEVATGRRVAVIGGYNVRWDETNPDRLVFSRHQYYGAPDYGSFEEVIAISQRDLLRAETFNENMNYEIIAEGEMQITALPDNVWQSAAWGDKEIQVRVADGRANIFIVVSGQEAMPLLNSEKNYNAFALDPAGQTILIREVSGVADEFGNLDANDDNTRFLLADIIENN